ncbi:HlyD family efflux transporter periplasmic adaptor subunit [Kiritimatiellota bacterium B12222]|nr:HlyD family efflux transporter periplasmic adaptor subunit [Kiritimatiellota bacterium B12222]
MKRVPSPSLFLILLTTFLLQACGNRPPSDEAEWIHPHPLPHNRILEEIGILEAKELMQVTTFYRGTISEIIDDGRPVKKGDLILTFDDEELRTNLDSEVLNLEQVQEDLENEITEYGVLTNSFQMATQLKTAEHAHAQLELDEALDTLPPENRRLLEIDIELAQLTLDEKQSQLEREIELVEKGFAPPSSLQEATRDKEAAEIFLKEKQSQLELAALPLPTEERLTLETKVKNAQDALTRNQAQQARDLHIQDLKIEGLKLKIKHSLEKIDNLNQQLDQVSIYAPTNGIIRLNHKWNWGMKSWMPLSAGQRLYELDMVGTVVDPHDLSLRIIIHESDYPFLKTGQQVNVNLTAFPNEEITGTLTNLTELGQDMDDLSPIYRQSPAIHQALFLATVTLDKLNDKAIPGMTASAHIEIGTGQGELVIPLAYVQEKAGHYYVIRKRAGQTETIEVKGRITEWGFEVSSGLKLSDQIKKYGEQR